MLDLLWGFLMIMGILYGILSGHLSNINIAVLDSAKECVSLCITMLGIMSVWTGLMEIAKDAGIISYLTRKLSIFFSLLFPGLPKNHPASHYISANMIANILGLGWAATPMGLKAMQELSKLESKRHHGSPPTVASSDMCTLLILNVSSLQLLPVNIIAYRSQYGSVSPTSFIGNAILATLFTTTVGIIFSIIARKYSKPPK